MTVLIRTLLAGIIVAGASLICTNRAYLRAEMVTTNRSVYPVDKCVFITLHIKNDKISLVEYEVLSQRGPDYLPGSYKFVAKVLSVDGTVLGEYGFADPRIILAEQGYSGPSRLDNRDFNLIVPYFDNAKTVNIFSDNKLQLSIDISNKAK